MPEIRDLFGLTFGKLTPFSAFKDNGTICWRCLCECGEEIKVEQEDLFYKTIDACFTCSQGSKETKKETLISVRLPQQLLDKLDTLCLDSGENRSDLIRGLIHREYVRYCNTC